MKNYKLIFFVFLCSLSASIFQPYQSLFLKEGKLLNSAQIGLVLTLTSISGLILSLFLGNLSDKKQSYKFFLRISVTSSFIGYILLSITRNYIFIIIIFTIFLGISSITTAQMFAFAKKEFKKNKKQASDSNIIRLRSIVSLSWSVGPIIASVLIYRFSFIGLSIGCSILYLLSFCLLNFISDDKKKSSLLPPSNKNINIKKSNYILLCNFITFTILESVNYISNTNIPIYVIKNLQANNNYVGIITSLSAIIEIPFMLIFAYFIKKDIQKQKIIAFGIISGILFLFFARFVTNLYIFSLLFILKSVFNATFKGLGIPFFQNLYSTDKVGFSTTIFTNTTRVGGAIGGIIIGTIGGYDNDFYLIAIILCVLSLIIFETQNIKN